MGSQETPEVADKFGVGVQNEAGQTIRELHQKNTHVIANTLFQQRRDGSTHGHHQMVNTKIRLIIFFAAKDGSSIQLAKTRPGADCDSDNQLLIVKFRLKLKGKTLAHLSMT